LLNILTVDVEDYYHVSAFEPYIHRAEWAYLPSRVEANIMKILDILENHKTKATFFVLGYIAEKIPALIKEIYNSGHEIACHGYAHKLAYTMTPKEFRADVRRARSIIEDSIGTGISGFRATSFSFIKSNLWCLDILIEEGFLYDSSIFPIYHDRYGIPNWQRFPHMILRNSGCIYELPPSTIRIFNNNIPIGGGAYLRLFPLSFICKGIRRINNTESKSAIIYIHPWEIDTGQPRIKVKRLTALRHYAGIRKFEAKIQKIIKEFEFRTAIEVINKALNC
jgi:polysaccharide deacetylase family protein (PEP-CTERM system associated)